MAQSDNLQNSTAPHIDELSPVKRALIEIRRLREELEVCQRGQSEPMAIIGVAVRLPGGVTSPERFWKALAEGEDLITTVPPERWDAKAYWSLDEDRPGTMYDVHGGFLSDIDMFDAEFFGIHPREAESMDPQQRILLELTWEALEHSAVDPRSLMNTQAGIFLGLSNSDYGRYLREDIRKVDGYTGVGAALSIAAGRLAYFLGTHGPAAVVDTACSSSLVAVHQAVQSLRRRETDLAIVGTANLILFPDMNVGFSRSQMLSHDGHCKTFDASADGYVRSEGCCVIVMKRLSDARRDGNRVLATIHGTAVNQDGRSAGITAPNGPAQIEVMRSALADAGVEPSMVSYVEAHGTGTPLGDPMEVQAIGTVYGQGRSAESPLRLGSVKTNLGHTEAAAGLTSLIKVVLMMQPGHGIVPHLHLKQPNPQIDWTRWPIEVPLHLTPWNDASEIRYAGVSSFGFSGTNAHLILGSADGSATGGEGWQEGQTAESEECLLCLSATQDSVLRTLAQRYVDFLQTSEVPFSDICDAAAVGRAKLTHRLALRACDSKTAAQMLEVWLAGGDDAALMTSAMDRTIVVVPKASVGGTLTQIQKEFVEGGMLRDAVRAAPGQVRHVDLPVYPFSRKRFWFGMPPLEKLRQKRDAAWQSAQIAAERQSQEGPLGWNLGHYPERWAALDRLNRVHARNEFVTAGGFPEGSSFTVEEVLQRCGFLPIYRHLIKRWLCSLAEEGVLVQSAEQFRAVGSLRPVDTEATWLEVSEYLADEPVLLAYLKRCGSLLGDVLTGRKSALETLFPDGSFALAEGLYETSTEARYFNAILTSALKAAVQCLGGSRDIRILEIGGGTGGSTSAILPRLQDGQAEYWFTDVSELFLNRAKHKFREYDFVRYALFDVDRDLEPQGFRPGMFDLIVAANVIHAARNLESTLNRVQHLLSPGGILVLLETTHHRSWFDMSTGLIEGWQHFEDTIRQEDPLLSPHQWRAVLEQAGFDEITALPRPDAKTADLGMHVLLARRRDMSEDQLWSAQAGSADVTHKERLVQQRRIQQSPQPGAMDTSFTEDLHGLPPEADELAVPMLVRETICSVFHLDCQPVDLGDRDRLSDLGMDSLIALELRGQLSKRLGLEGKISSTIAFDTGTVGELVRSLVGLLTPPEKESEQVSPRIAPVFSRQRTSITAEQLEEMSEEDVEELLKDRLSKQ